MKAFEVVYSGGGYSGCTEIVLAENEGAIGCSLEAKSNRGYAIGDHSCRIDRYKEIPLGKVKLTDLSVEEFLQLTK